MGGNMIVIVNTIVNNVHTDVGSDACTWVGFETLHGGDTI